MTLKNQVVETACGTCKLGLKGKECELAIKVNNQSYFVDGTKIDDHGDAHGKNGFCNAVRKAKVSGTIVNGRFQSTSFVLIKQETPKKKAS
ncbi:MAG: hypothetical protein EOP48_10115 [Sphingobacteriales bacterium]|nr:MAG: hypothetical protein EOP48_10115 [Sphingobacteriales bacterium]